MSECVHHWILDSPNGTAFVAAQCKKCGTTKTMNASGDIPDGVGGQSAIAPIRTTCRWSRSPPGTASCWHSTQERGPARHLLQVFEPQVPLRAMHRSGPRIPS